jgi:HK97 family phage portal protein
MKIFGWTLTRGEEKGLSPVASNRGGWFPLIREPFTGAWQRNMEEMDLTTLPRSPAIYACVTLIASDIAKLRVKLVERNVGGIWQEVESPAFSPVLRKPNRYQTRIQFWEYWILSKLQRGNAYILKERDERGVVTALYPLDPSRVKPLVSDEGSVFYDLSADNLSGLEFQVVVPASEIIHDRMNCLFHPLVGTSPIFAAAIAAMQGLKIQDASSAFFANGAQPSGVLTAPGEISEETATRLKDTFQKAYTGTNAGKIIVAGDGLKYEPMMMSSVDAQLIEQLKWTAEVVASTFHVPPYKIGLGPMPTNNNVQALNVEYYSQALQRLIEDAELCLDEGLGLTTPKDGRLLGTEFDLDGLLRMDTATQMDVLSKGREILTTNEARRKLDLPKVSGGDTVYRQQQDFSLEALAKRDAKADPFGTEAPAAPPAAPVKTEDDTERALLAAIRFKFAEALHVA